MTEIYNNTGSRTIAVDGEDEFDVVPDLVKLSFEIKEERLDYQDAINMVLVKLSEARAKVIATGVSNDFISSDSLSVREREVNPLDANGKKKKKDELGTLYLATIIMRVRLEGETVSQFGELMIQLTAMGLISFEAPTYETSELTALRNEAREHAVINAREKAEIMVNGLGSEHLKLGKPISIFMVPVDISDDSDESFTGNSRSWFLAPRRLSASTNRFGYDEPEPEESASKALLLDKLKHHVNDLFVMPPITIKACVSIVFEIDDNTPTKKSELR